MTWLVSKEEQLKFMVRTDLRERLDEIFPAQGVSMKVGLTRLIEFLAHAPPELRPLLLNQLPGVSRDAVITRMLEEMKPPKRSRRPRSLVEDEPNVKLPPPPQRGEKQQAGHSGRKS